MKPQFIFITGTDTGVGKTVFATLLTEWFVRHGHATAALKPVSSGTRSDGRHLRDAQCNDLTLDEINPWHFRAAIAPVLAARRERARVRLQVVIDHIRRVAQKFDVIIVEGAGGLLSPLGDDFNSRDIITALCAAPVVVAPNRLGVVNHVLLTLEALPPSTSRSAEIVLIKQPKPDTASRSNARLLGEFVEAQRIHELPWLREHKQRTRAAAAIAPIAAALLNHR